MDIIVSLFALGATAVLALHMLPSAPKTRPIPVRRDERPLR